MLAGTIAQCEGYTGMNTPTHSDEQRRRNRAANSVISRLTNSAVERVRALAGVTLAAIGQPACAAARRTDRTRAAVLCGEDGGRRHQTSCKAGFRLQRPKSAPQSAVAARQLGEIDAHLGSLLNSMVE